MTKNVVTKMEDKRQIPPEPRPEGLALLREPFPANQVSKLPKPTKRQTEEVRNDFKKGIRCQLCGQWHHPQVQHLDYVGHAALTDRLLDADPGWNWEPLAFTEHGTPLMDQSGGMWIKLTVCGETRLGYGHADGKSGGDAIKEVIGDALRNAAMRFGAALDLWHKGELHVTPEEPEPEPEKFNPRATADLIITKINAVEKLEDLADAWVSEHDALKEIKAADAEIFEECAKAKDARKADLTPPPAADIGDDEIPY